MWKNNGLFLLGALMADKVLSDSMADPAIYHINACDAL